MLQESEGSRVSFKEKNCVFVRQEESVGLAELSCEKCGCRNAILHIGGTCIELVFEPHCHNDRDYHGKKL